MKKIIFFLFLLPVIANAQCPELIGQPYSQAMALKAEIEKVAGLSFTDSTIKGDHQIITFEGGRTRFKVSTRYGADEVQSITITAPDAAIRTLVTYFDEKYKPCTSNQGAQWRQYNGFKLVFQSGSIHLSKN